MTEQQRAEELEKCEGEISQTEELILHHRTLYNQVRHKYERAYKGVKFNLKVYIENKTNDLSFLTLKMSILKNPNINLSGISVEKLDSFVQVRHSSEIALPKFKNQLN